MKKTLLCIVLLFCMSTIESVANSKVKIKTGLEVLKEQNFKQLQGKRVGLITNPTGVDDNLKSTIDILHDAPNVNLVALFGPEHGVRGNLHAGDKVSNSTDVSTGLPVYSLYGKTRKPTPEMLTNIDVLVYDIQDIGCRSYSFISTMGAAIEAAAENNIDFIVLDRPNPLGGMKVEGSVAEDRFTSFISKFKIPYIYGLTCGELALMLNGDKLIQERCRLEVIEMKGWKRKMHYEDTGLQWIPTSPHIPEIVSAYSCSASGLLGELGYVSVGVGYTLPFQLFAAEWIDATTLSYAMNRLKLPGVAFTPTHIKPFYAVGQGKNLQGVQMHILDFEKAKLSEVQFFVMQEIARLYPDHAVFENADADRHEMFDRVIGSDYIRLTFTKTNKFEDIRTFWYKDVDMFREKSKNFYLYK